MTEKQYDRLCERAKKYGYVKTLDGAELVYWGVTRYGETYSIKSSNGNSIGGFMTKSEAKFYYVD